MNKYVVKRCGSVVFIGATNVGKSSLINTIIGEKVSIVTHKAQTTRTSISGIFTTANTQVIVKDTPGFFLPKKNLESALLDVAWHSVKTADHIALIIDVTRPNNPSTLFLIRYLKSIGRSCIAVLHKIDLVNKGALLPLATTLGREKIFTEIFMTSAIKEIGITPLKRFLETVMPVGDHLFSKDTHNPMPSAQVAAEITREKCFLHLHQELPYSLTVKTENWQNFTNGDIKIQQVIYVKRPSQRVIVLGNGGKNIKRIGTSARIALSRAFAKNVHLSLHVTAEKDWKSKERITER